MTFAERLALLPLALLSLAATCDHGPTFPPYTPAPVAGSPVRAEFKVLGDVTVTTSGKCDVAVLAIAEGSEGGWRRERSPSLYFGRLAGPGGMAPHQHDGVREVLCIIDGSGTFTLAGHASHFSPKQCIQIPPSTDHAWQMDPGETLSAFQIFVPPGPEQRLGARADETR